MTVPNTPAGPGAEQMPAANPYAVDPYLQPPPRERRPLLPELRIGVLLTVAGALLGIVVGLLWLWLAPRVMLVAATEGGQYVVRYVDPEGEQRAGADSVLALLGLGAGAVSALAAFLFTRARGGGIAVAAGLTAGGLAGSLIAWKLGERLGPSKDVFAHAKAAGLGVPFSAAIQLGAKGAVLVWPMAALVLLLILTAAFGKREEDPPPYWAGPEWAGPGQTFGGIVPAEAGHIDAAPVPPGAESGPGAQPGPGAGPEPETGPGPGPAEKPETGQGTVPSA
ncbi:hypothetical protein ACFC1R_11580 [Kitasatospora sp. NPDC056138]|uniref:hypothetical protein n=1 Tax=Kitasatospora sp. NPDC056138 TaxID=3345724 RepID=UPI0035E04109